MRILFFLSVALLFINDAYAARVVSDATTQTVTHCGVVLDNGTKSDIPVAVSADGKYCDINVTDVSVGVHNVKATFVNVDPVWGRVESAFSAPFTFTKPNLTAPSAPAGLVIKP